MEKFAESVVMKNSNKGLAMIELIVGLMILAGVVAMFASMHPFENYLPTETAFENIVQNAIYRCRLRSITTDFPVYLSVNQKKKCFQINHYYLDEDDKRQKSSSIDIPFNVDTKGRKINVSDVRLLVLDPLPPKKNGEVSTIMTFTGPVYGKSKDAIEVEINGGAENIKFSEKKWVEFRKKYSRRAIVQAALKTEATTGSKTSYINIFF